jgi:uncharacterized membrane protein HdeD (DUF308 family)
MNTISSSIVASVKNWWWFIIKGLLLIAAGVAVLARPLEGYVGLSVLFSIVILSVGLSQIFFAVGNTRALKGWGWTLVAGIIDVAIGFFLLIYPLVTMATLPFFVGFWLMFRAFFLMGISFDLNSMGIPNWGWILVGGILLLILSGMVLYYPAAGAVSIVAWSAAAFITAGVFNIALAFTLNSIKKDVKSLEGKMKSDPTAGLARNI